MVLLVLVNKLKSVILILIGFIKRSLCCFRRRRRLSCDSEPLTNIGVVSNYETQKKYDEMHNWNSWEEPESVVTDRTPNTVQQFIEMYRQQANAKPEDEPQTNFFEDMTPRITRQTKVLVHSNQQQFSNSEATSRLAVSQDPVPLPDSELGSWDEREGVGSWEEEQWDTDALVREKRKQERERRIIEHAKRRMEKEQLRTLGARIS